MRLNIQILAKVIFWSQILRKSEHTIRILIIWFFEESFRVRV